MTYVLLLWFATCGHKSIPPKVCDSVPSHVAEKFRDSIENNRFSTELNSKHLNYRDIPLFVEDGYLVSTKENWCLKICKDAKQLWETDDFLLIYTGKLYTFLNLENAATFG